MAKAHETHPGEDATETAVRMMALWPSFGLHMDWGYVKDQVNILEIVDAGSGWIEAFPAGNRTSQTVNVHLSQIFANLGYQEY